MNAWAWAAVALQAASLTVAYLLGAHITHGRMLRASATRRATIRQLTAENTRLRELCERLLREEVSQ